MVIGTASCQFNGSASGEENSIDYYSREIEYCRYVDPDEYFLEPVETRIYGNTGSLRAIYRYSYKDVVDKALYPDDVYYANHLTEVYEVSDDGTESLAEYYQYEYARDEYEYEDDDGFIQTGYDYILTKGETYSADKVKRLYYDVTYLVIDDDYDCYLSIKDYKADGTEIARQEATYLKESGYVAGYRTEKFYKLNDDETSLILSEEYACWYDDYYDYDYELYHSYYSNDNNPDNEFYYFTRYSRDGNGDVYEQADFEYDPTVHDGVDPNPPAHPDDPDPNGVPGYNTGDNSFTLSPLFDAIDYTGDVDAFDYDIFFGRIGDKATVLTTDYDSSGNIILDERSLNGVLSEYTSYSYNSDNELTEQCRYTQGGTLLYDRISIRYSEEYRDDVYYRIKNTYTYKYYDYEEYEDQAQSSSRCLSSGVVNKIKRLKSINSQNNRKEVF